MDFALAKQLAEKKATEFVGQPTAKCPPVKSCLMVVVYKADTREVIKGAKVQVSGTGIDKKGRATQKSESNKTDGKGLAKFKPWDPGDYTLDISLPSADGYEKPEVTRQSVASGNCPVCCIAVKPLPKLKVKVVEKGRHSRVFSDAVVKVVSAPQRHGDQKTTRSGIADFGTTQSGKYVFQVTSLKEEDRKEFAVSKAQVEETLSSGDDKTVIIEIEKINVVTPKIETEYKVVLFDRGLSKYQEATEKKIYPDPTYIQLSFRQTDTSNPFQKGAKVKFSPANVEVYLDDECKKKATGDPATGIDIKPEEISNLSGHKLYLRGKKAGKFKVILELKDPESSLIRLDKNPAEEEMGVVEIILKVFEHDTNELAKIEVDPDTDPISTYHTNLKDKELPKQVVMTSEKKVKVGRFLHAQKDNNFSRAKLVVAINRDEWPAGTDAYKIAFDKEKTSGDVEIFDAEWEGEVRGSFTVASLKGREQSYWLQGKSVTTKLRDLRLFLTLDRAEYDLPKTPKRNADWARITVVEIEEVKVHYSADPGKAVAWNEAEKRFYINFKDDPDGRKVTIGAKLSQKLKDVTIHLMLAPDKDNLKQANWGGDLPDTWKWKDIDAALKHKDKDGRKKLLHLSAKTDENGLAKKEVVLSRFGGDKFWPAAYIDQDPHLAKYVDGHADLEKKQPVFGDEIIVWRKFWYQEIKVTGLFVAGFGNAAETYKDVKAVMEAADVKEMPRATANGLRPRVIYPKHMVSYYVDTGTNSYVNNYPGDASDGLVVGDANESRFFALKVAATDKPVMIPMLNAHGLWIASGPTSNVTTPWEAAFPITVVTDKELLDPPLQGGTLFNAGQWEALDHDAAANGGAGAWVNRRSGALAAADVTLSSTRSDPREVQIKRPAALVMTATTQFRITGLVLNGGQSFLGTSYPDGIVNGYTPNDQVDFINTINHEIGHSFKQVSKPPPTGIPNHPHQYDKDGSHCSYQNKSCLMYESGPQPIHLDRYCPVCHPYVLVQDMSRVRS
jgi:hypothetical protein